MGEREPDGFDDFVAESSTRLLRSAYLLTHDWHAAEDLVQTALVRVLPRWRRIRRVDDPAVYVRKVLLNQFLSGRARRWTAEEPFAEPPDHRTAGVEPDSDLRLVLLGVLAQLPPRQRAVVVLRFFDDLTETTTAEVLGCSVGTVKSQTARALARLRDHPSLRAILTEEVTT